MYPVREKRELLRPLFSALNGQTLDCMTAGEKRLAERLRAVVNTD